MIRVDREQIKNWTAVEGKPSEVLISYKAEDEKTSCKLFLCKATVGQFLISEINDQTISDISQKEVSIIKID